MVLRVECLAIIIIITIFYGLAIICMNGEYRLEHSCELLHWKYFEYYI